MKEAIDHFIQQKQLSKNSRLAYTYDLEQFLEQVGTINDTSLRLYQSSLQPLKLSVQKRKLSAVNQFLYFLYDQKYIEHYYKLNIPKDQKESSSQGSLLDLSVFWQESQVPQGRLIALLILENGLLPSEILSIKVTDIQFDFQILSVDKAGQKRIVQLSSKLTEELSRMVSGTYLFEKKGKPYSRQWAFRQLEAFLSEKGQAGLSAQSLREQYILRQLKDKRSLHDIARDLGLKSITTLEKYR